MSLIQGSVGSQDYATQARYIDGEGRIYFNPKRMDFPLITFLGINGRKEQIVGDAFGGQTKVTGKALSKRQVENAQFEIFTDTVQENATTINNAAGYNAAATSIVVADATLYTANDVAMITRTGETMLVTASNTTTNTLTVVRGYGATAAAILDLDSIVRLASAYPVNALSGTAKSTQVQREFNYTQIFRTPVQISRTDMNSKLNYSSASDWERLKPEAAVEHLKSQERAFWFGRRNQATDSGSSQRQRTTGGVYQFVTTNVTDLSAAGGVLTPQVMDAFAEQVFQFGGTTKFAFCSPRALSRVNGLAFNQIRITPEESAYGLNLTKYTTSHGELILVRSPLFGDTGFVNQHGGDIVVIDPDQIKYAYLKDAENVYHDNIQENDRDGRKGEWICEAGLNIANEKAHGILQGIA